MGLRIYNSLTNQIDEFVPIEDGKVSITVYNLKGDKVTTLLKENKTSGIYSTEWNADNLAAGVYFINLEFIESGGGSHQQTQKVILLK